MFTAKALLLAILLLATETLAIFLLFHTPICSLPLSLYFPPYQRCPLWMQYLQKQDPTTVFPNKVQDSPTRGLDALIRVFPGRVYSPLPK